MYKCGIVSMSEVRSGSRNENDLATDFDGEGDELSLDNASLPGTQPPRAAGQSLETYLEIIEKEAILGGNLVKLLRIT